MRTVALLLVASLGPLASAQTVPQLDWYRLPPQQLADHAVAFDAKASKVVLQGGVEGTRQRGETWLWDGSAWEVEPELGPGGRSRHAMAFDAVRGVTILFGGRFGTSDLGDTWSWDGTKWTVLRPVHAPAARSGHAMAFDPLRGRIVLFGGRNASGDLADTWEWDGQDWVVRALPGPSARHGHAMAWHGGIQRMVLVGGLVAGKETADVHQFDGVQWQFRHQAPMKARSGHATAWDPNTKELIVTGGFDANGTLSDCWRFDGQLWNAMPAPVGQVWYSRRATTDVARSRVVLVGWGPGKNEVETWEWDGMVWAQPAMGWKRPGARLISSCVWDDARSEAIMFGGHVDNASPLDDTWSWNGRRWRQLAPAKHPSKRWFAASCYFPAAKAIVLFGGYDVANNGGFADTWHWTGSNWVEVTPTSNSPAPTEGAELALDPNTGHPMLFGGRERSSYRTGQFLWNGTNWTNLTAPPGPQARFERFVMQLDPLRKRVVVAAGEDANLQLMRDTWEWDGQSWIQMAPITSPSARSWIASAFDPRIGKVVVHGGRTTQSLDDTWLWDGKIWQQLAANGARGKLYGDGASMFFDAVRDAIVVYGGRGPSDSVLSDATWVLAPVPFPGRFESYGPGCPGSNGIITLAPYLGSRAAIGTVFTLEITNLPLAASLAFFDVGASRTAYYTIPLPWDLKVLGAPNCFLHQSREWTLTLLPTAGRALQQFAIPAQDSLLGAQVFMQSFCADPGTNQAGLILSGGYEVTVGAW